MKGPLCLLAALLVATLVHAPGRAAPPSSVPASAPSATATPKALRRAIEHYQRSEFKEAEALLLRLRARLAGQRSREAQEAHTYLAFVHAAFGRQEQALSAFEKALEIRPSMTLPDASPKIARLFVQARQRWRAKLRALDHDPPRLEHEAQHKVLHGQKLEITASATDRSPIKEVLLNYRVATNRGWTTVKMERTKDGRYIASVPSSVVVRPGVEYYVEAWDELGNGPGLKGSTRAPIRVTVEGGPLAASRPATARPWYKKWWVWAIAAGAAAAAGGTAAAIYLNRDQQARIDIDWPQGELSP